MALKRGDEHSDERLAAAARAAGIEARRTDCVDGLRSDGRRTVSRYLPASDSGEAAYLYKRAGARAGKNL